MHSLMRVSENICICIHILTGMHAYTYRIERNAKAWRRVDAFHLCVCVFKCVCVRVNMCEYAYICIRRGVQYVCVCSSVCVCACMCMNMYTYRSRTG